MEANHPWWSIPAGVIGGAIGGVAGFFIVGWLMKQGLYAMLIPGGLIGMGAGFSSRIRSHFIALLAGVGALVLGFYTEWHYRPFLSNQSLDYFFKNLGKLSNMTWLMIIGGAALAYWFAIGSERVRSSQVKLPTVSDEEVDAYVAEKAGDDDKLAGS